MFAAVGACALGLVVQDERTPPLLPAPFSRELHEGLNGTDVFVLQHMLQRAWSTGVTTNCSLACVASTAGTGTSNCTVDFNRATAESLACFQEHHAVVPVIFAT
jgi:hypothetical protein